MNILWLKWKDRTHPEAGGAELLTEEIIKRLVEDGHKVKIITGGYKDCLQKETVDGAEIIRLGNKFTTYFKTYRYYKKNLVGWSDVVIDEINTIPYFAKFYSKEPSVIFVHQLCRQIWFYQMIFPLSLVGYIVEPFYLWLMRKSNVITVSESTKQDLVRFGYDENKINIISEGIELSPIKNTSETKKYSQPTVLSLGSLRPMKRTIDQIKAFEIAKQEIPKLKMKIAGGGSESKYGKKVLATIEKSPYSSDIEYLGRVSREYKKELMQNCHYILVTSIKEGWGLIVTEAASQGTPAIAYSVDGLRDSVIDNRTGLLSTSNPQALSSKILKAFSLGSKEYEDQRVEALEFSKNITFKNATSDFTENIEKIRDNSIVDLNSEAKGSSVCLIGYYGGGNYGDELLCEIMLNKLSSAKRVNLFYLDEVNFKKWHSSDFKNVNLIKSTSLKQVLIAILKSKKILIGGGGLWSADSNLKTLLMSATLLFSRYILRKDVILYGVGYYNDANRIGALSGKIAKLSATKVVARDELSYANFNGEESKKVTINEDLAYSIEDYSDNYSTVNNLKINKKTILLSLRGENTENIRDAVITLSVKYPNIDFIYLQFFDDKEYEDANLSYIREKTKGSKNFKVIEFTYNPIDLFNTLKTNKDNVVGVIAPQFHAIVLMDIIEDIDFMPLYYSEKNKILLNEISDKKPLHIKDVNLKAINEYIESVI